MTPFVLTFAIAWSGMPVRLVTLVAGSVAVAAALWVVVAAVAVANGGRHARGHRGTAG